MQLPIRLQLDAKRSLQEQLFDDVVRRIEDGRLRPGTQLPTTRQLAADLGISRNTVAFAYERLGAEGFIETRPPHGTFVAAFGAQWLAARAAMRDSAGAAPAAGEAPAPAFEGHMHALHPPQTTDGARPAFDFWVGRPDARLFPSQTWRGLIDRSLAGMQHGDGSYGEPAGLHKLRQAVAGHAGAARGIVCEADDVLITNGIQEGINIACRLLLGRGAAVGMESPGYAGAANVFVSYGARVLPVEVDAEGAVAGRMPPACRLMYLTPAHQYPTGVALSPSRRQEWLRWAAQRGAYLIEDDYDSDFYYDSVPLPALKAGETDGRVIYLGTFSKCLAAGLRLGYMIVPRPLRRDAATVKGLLTNGSPWLVQTSMADFIDSGEFVHHLRRLRLHYRARRDALVQALAQHFGQASLSGAQAGMHVLWHLAQGTPPAEAIEPRALAHGVGVYGLRRGNAWVGDATGARWQHTLLLGYAALNEQEIAAGVARLAQALR